MAVTGRFGRIEDYVFIKDAVCDLTEDVGDWVYVYVGGKPYTVRKADPTNFDKMPVVGVIIEKLTPTSCKVQLRGETEAIFTGLESGRIYFLGTDSKLVLLPPAPQVGEYAFVQALCVATSENTVEVKPELNLTKRINEG